MSIHTPSPTRPPTRHWSPADSLDYFADQHRLQTPVYLPYDVEQSEVWREFLRLPTFFWIPVSVALLTYVGLHSFVLMIPAAILMSTVSSFSALARARARLAERHLRALAMGLIPLPRSAAER